VYLAGVLILSAVTLHEPKASANGRVSHHTARNKTQLDPTLQQSDRGQQLSRLKNYEYGIPGLRPPLRRSKIQWCTELKYVNPPRTPVALVSFPGSGNTWLRYLLQQATGRSNLRVDARLTRLSQVSTPDRSTRTTDS
jgi:hypothetical protein